MIRQQWWWWCMWTAIDKNEIQTTQIEPTNFPFWWKFCVNISWMFDRFRKDFQFNGIRMTTICGSNNFAKAISMFDIRFQTTFNFEMAISNVKRIELNWIYICLICTISMRWLYHFRSINLLAGQWTHGHLLWLNRPKGTINSYRMCMHHSFDQLISTCFKHKCYKTSDGSGVCCTKERVRAHPHNFTFQSFHSLFFCLNFFFKFEQSTDMQ